VLVLLLLACIFIVVLLRRNKDENEITAVMGQSFVNKMYEAGPNDDGELYSKDGGLGSSSTGTITRRNRNSIQIKPENSAKLYDIPMDLTETSTDGPVSVTVKSSAGDGAAEGSYGGDSYEIMPQMHNAAGQPTYLDTAPDPNGNYGADSPSYATLPVMNNNFATEEEAYDNADHVNNDGRVHAVGAYGNPAYGDDAYSTGAAGSTDTLTLRDKKTDSMYQVPYDEVPGSGANDIQPAGYLQVGDGQVAAVLARSASAVSTATLQQNTYLQGQGQGVESLQANAAYEASADGVTAGGGDDVYGANERSGVCGYIGARNCETLVNVDTLFCSSHACPGCTSSKSSKEEVCATCAGDDVYSANERTGPPAATNAPADAAPPPLPSKAGNM